MRRDMEGALRASPKTLAQLLRRMKDDLPSRSLVEMMREFNDDPSEEVIVAATGLGADMTRPWYYWIPPKRVGAKWRRIYRQLGIDPNEAHVV